MNAVRFDWDKFFEDNARACNQDLSALAHARFPTDNTLAEAAVDHADNALRADDFRRLQTFGGRCSPRGYLRKIARNLIEDFARKQFGRPRPPTWLKKIGGVWEDLWVLLCIERNSTQSAINVLETRIACTRAEILAMISKLREKLPDCGKDSRGARASLDDEQLQRLADTDGVSPEESAVKDQAADTLDPLRQVFSFLLGEKSGSGEVPTQLVSVIMAAVARAEITPEESLILRCIYVEELSYVATGARLGLPEHQVRRRESRILDRLRAELLDEGLGSEALPLEWMGSDVERVS